MFLMWRIFNGTTFNSRQNKKGFEHIIGTFSLIDVDYFVLICMNKFWHDFCFCHPSFPVLPTMLIILQGEGIRCSNLEKLK